ncbi:hypothetical protein NLJ89_g6539 [Agrocybe chaxingu]|uniref:Glycosyl hydrolase family 13 catalytic domain-containing protein n=1 Tax=Agrocybe chaxingu TaxID=84603 RepID=A0A9W8JY42_9AGAR|nr:hypothetical protein NLJ89_g6539 [Agrocybe chaxingu]
MFAKLKSWLVAFKPPPSPLLYMRVGPVRKDANPLMLQFFTWDTLHDNMSWWKHFETEVPRLASLGFTQVWLPPPNKAAEPLGRGYDAYDLWDLGEFNQKGTVKTRWGTREEYLQACKVAKEHGIDILIDAVLNHKLGADRVETFQVVPVQPDNRLKDAGPTQEIEGWTAFEYPGRENKYGGMRWNREHFSGVDWDHKTRTRGIYRIIGPGHKGWSRNVDSELGNYDFLLGIDIDHRHPAVREDLANWGQWIIEVSPKRMIILTTFFDVPLHMNFNQASRERTRYDLRKILRDTIVQVKPNDAVTFVDNHDTVEGQSLESWVGDNFKVQAYAIILLRGYGLPCVFYGDLYPNRECYNENIARNITLLIEARKNFAYGATEDYLADRNCIGFENAGKVFGSHMTQHGRVEIDGSGCGTFSCFANNVQVWTLLAAEEGS